MYSLIGWILDNEGEHMQAHVEENKIKLGKVFIHTNCTGSPRSCQQANVKSFNVWLEHE